jgi:hypothetical protein
MWNGRKVSKKRYAWYHATVTIANHCQLELVNTYVSDPAHIAPSRSDANSNGHFPPANGNMPAGTPRGFNLNNFSQGGMPMVAGFPPGQFPPFFGGRPGQAPGAWAGGEAGGPVRRGGGRFNSNTRAGPYDRNPRNPRWGENGGGRLSPPPGGGRGGRQSGAGRWGDGNATGGPPPREAVQGRSLKSYEDLDAVAGGGGGELNY